MAGTSRTGMKKSSKSMRTLLGHFCDPGIGADRKALEGRAAHQHTASISSPSLSSCAAGAYNATSMVPPCRVAQDSRAQWLVCCLLVGQALNKHLIDELIDNLHRGAQALAPFHSFSTTSHIIQTDVGRVPVQ